MEIQENDIPSGESHRSRFWISLLFIIIIVPVGGFWYLRYDAIKQNQVTMDFVKQIILSVVNRTDYYKEHTSDRFIGIIADNLNKISLDYKIKTIDYDSSYYEYHITFNGKDKFYISVVKYSKNDLQVCGFVPVLLEDSIEPNEIDSNKN